MNNIKPNIVHMLFGSHLYGLDTPLSDKDYKGIYLPNLKSLLLNDYPKTINTSTGDDKSKNSKEDIDSEIFALPYFIKNACDGETFALDMLHCTNPITNSLIWEDIISQREKFYSKNMKAYIGYVKKQAAKYGLKGTRLADIRNSIQSLEKIVPNDTRLRDIDPNSLYTGEYVRWTKYKGKGAGAVEQNFYEVNSKKYQDTNTVEYVLEQLNFIYDSYGDRAKQAESNEGVEWKSISHALRAGYQARDIYKYGDFEYPLKETEFLLAVKTGQLNYTKEVAPVLEDLVEDVYKLSDNSKLPNKVDRVYWDNWLLDIYGCYLM